MKWHQWSLALAALGVVSINSVVNAEEAKPQLLTALSATSISGSVDTSMIWQMKGGLTDVGRSYDGSDRQDGFNVNVVQINIVKPLSEGPWSAGYKISLIAGPDAAAAAGGGQVGLHNAFVKLHAPVGNGLDVKVGLFSSIVGYEYFESQLNPNYSHSYGFYLEPGRQTGAVADYKVCDGLSISAGVGNAYSPGRVNVRPFGADGQQLSGNLNAMFSFTLTAPESMGFLKGAWIYGTFVQGTTAVPSTTGITATDYFIGAGMPTPIKGLDLVLTYDYVTADRDGVVNAPGFPPNHAGAASLYLVYKAADKLTFANRFDYANGSSGAFGGTSNSSDEFISEVLTVTYALWANVTTRAEFRWDHDLAALNGGTSAFDGKRDSLSLAMNIVYAF